MKYIFTLLILFLLSCNNIQLSNRGNIIDTASINNAKKDYPIMEIDEQFFLRNDPYIRALYPPTSLKNSYFEVNFEAKPIYFKENSAEVTSQTYKSLSYIVQKIKDNPKCFVVLNGYTYKENPIDNFNEQLSELRALAIKNSLASYGVSPKRVFTNANGEATPVNEKIDINTFRRVNIIIGIIREK